MAYSYIELPKDRDELGKVLWATARREEIAANWKQLRWWLAYAYLALGARRFDVYNPETKELRWSYLDEEGNVDFQSQDLLKAITDNIGKLESMNYEPMCTTQPQTLDAIRQRAVCQIIADSAVDSQQVAERKKQFNTILMSLGCCGIGAEAMDHASLGLIGDLEVIHPNQVYPFPSLGRDYTMQCGIQRIRWVPMKWLADRMGKKIKSEEIKRKMVVVSRRPGVSLEKDGPSDSHEISSFHDGKHYGPEGGEEEAVRIVEVWTYGPRNTNARYMVGSGEHVLADVDYKGKEVYCPIGWARCLETGNFYGAGLFDLLFPQCRELEQLEKSLYNNIRDTDRYGLLVLPQGQFNKRSVMEDVGGGLRVLLWQPDALSEGFTPFNIQPYNTRDLPGKIAQFARERIQDLNPLKNLMEEKGRVDSASGLQIIDEKITEGMTTTTSSIHQAWGTMYRELVRKVAGEMVKSNRALPINKLTLDLVGVKIDRKEGTVRFGENPVPSVGRIHFGIREQNPRSKVARKMEALNLYTTAQATGEMTLNDLIMFCLEENLDLAVWSDPQKAAREAVTADIIELVGDGVTPGEVKIADYTVEPNTMLKILSGFMSRPIVRLFSPEVKGTLKDYRDSLTEFMQGVLPEGVPTPDDQAMMNQQQEALMSETPLALPPGGMNNAPSASAPAF